MGKRILRIIQRQDAIRTFGRRNILLSGGSQDRDRALEGPLQYKKTSQQPRWKAPSSGNFSPHAQTTCEGFISTVSGSKTPGWSAEETLKRINGGYFKGEINFGETKNFGKIEEPELTGHVSIDFIGIQRAAIKVIINAICAINSSAARHKTLDKLRWYALSGTEDSDLVLVEAREKSPEQLSLFHNKYVHSITIAALKPKALALISLYGKPFSYLVFDAKLSNHLQTTVGVKSIAFNFNDRTSRIFDLLTEFPDFHRFGAKK